MTYISIRREGGRVTARLYDGGFCSGATSWGTADEALAFAWAWWGSHIPAFIRPEARP